MTTFQIHDLYSCQMLGVLIALCPSKQILCDHKSAWPAAHSCAQESSLAICCNSSDDTLATTLRAHGAKVSPGAIDVAALLLLLVWTVLE